jgi:hypothetical protein
MASNPKLEPYYSLRDVRRLFFPSRSIRWLTDQAKAGAFGQVVKDAGGWLLPESGILEYLRQRTVTP